MRPSGSPCGYVRGLAEYNLWSPDYSNSAISPATELFNEVGDGKSASCDAGYQERGLRAPPVIPDRTVRTASSSGSPAYMAALISPVITGTGGSSPSATS